eukprot:gene605-1168_t
MKYMMLHVRTLFLAYLWILDYSSAIIPSGVLQSALPTQQALYCAPGSFSSKLPNQNDNLVPQTVLIPKNNKDGCKVETASQNLLTNNFVWLVERGGCNFIDKGKHAAQAGASGLIVYNSLKGIYQNKTYANPMDYECNYGRGYVKNIIPPVWSDAMTAHIPTSCTNDKKCKSGICVFTNKTTSEGHEVCCAFDLYMSMGRSSSSSGNQNGHEPVNIPVVFIRIKDVLSMINPSSNFNVVYLYARYEPFIDPSSIFIWLLAVCTVAAGALRVAKEDENNNSVEDSLSRRRNGITASNVGSVQGAAVNESSNFEVSPTHAVLWAIGSACMLFLIFYINLYNILSVIYVIASAVTSFVVFFRPMFTSFYGQYFPPGKVLETAAMGSGLVCSIILVSSWSIAMEMDSSWIWLPQDIMGVAVCFMAMSVVRLPTFKVAVLLLGMMFFYDIFFVFITPYFFDSSIMLKVASGGKEMHNDENFCEKYPSHADCKKASLPMLLIFPTLMSYSSDGSLLGLGDIVLPGTLVAFTARLDWKVLGPLRWSSPTSVRLWLGGCFVVTVCAYAIGLMLANVAVVVFNTGQPALLYINPLVLTAVALWSYNKGVLLELWRGPSVLNSVVTGAVVVGDGEDQGLLDALPMAKKLQFGNVSNSATSGDRNSENSGGRLSQHRTTGGSYQLDDDGLEEGEPI